MTELQGYQKIPLDNLREQVIDQLKLNYAHDNLDVSEFEKRLDQATNSDKKGELISLVEDLPVLENNDPQAATNKFRMNTGPIRPRDTMLAILGGVERSGVWKPAENIKILAVMGGVDLNFAQAELPPAGVEIEIFCLMGGVDIIVPEGVNVELHGVPILGGIENKSSGNYYPGAPTITIRGAVLLGGIDVKPPKKKKKRRFLS